MVRFGFANGLELDYMIGERTLFQAALRYTQTLTPVYDYYGPLDITVGLAWEFGASAPVDP